jgi:hypothetical protein
MISRRSLVSSAMKFSAGLIFSRAMRSHADVDSPLNLKLGHAEAIPIPEDFIGLGYEMSSVAPLGLLSAHNRRYVKLVNGLGTKGVIRVGGIVANYTRYDPAGTIKAEKQNTVITRASLDQLNGFLKETGWTAIWSVNFAQGTADDAVREAKAVAGVLGESLLALEIGNEVENYFRGDKPFRRAPYTYQTYRAEYTKWHDAIVAAVPGVRFAAPDTASNLDWPEQMAADAHGDVQLLTTHYYRANQARGSADQLTVPDLHLMQILQLMRTASEKSGIPWRLCETNSFSGGGRPGVSDSFLAALWTLDLLLLLAANKCDGVNIETGINQLGFVSSYSPIQDDDHGVNSAGVPYYGMLAFAYARRGCTHAIPIDWNAPSPSVTAYALGTPDRPESLVVINRDAQTDAQISLKEIGLSNATAIRLSAPSMESRTDVTFGRASVDPNGKWQPKDIEKIHRGLLFVPRGSAVVVRNPNP